MSGNGSRRKTAGLAAFLFSLVIPLATRAQDPAPETVLQLPEITVTTTGGSAAPFEVPGSVDRVEGEEIRDGRMLAQLSEGLAAVPGLQLQNRHNMAQDLQLSIRGFGARSTFGVRGVRIYVDGIPATMPDGQGQTSNIDIASADRVEVLRGPFSALYGNSSGGVVQAFTATGDGPPELSYSFAAGSFGTWRHGVTLTGSQDRFDYLFSANRYHTDGWRDHSAASRNLIYGKLGLSFENGGRLTFVFNRVDIDAQDPGGLTAGEFALAPREASRAEQYNTRKSVRQDQIGLLWEQPLTTNQDLRIMVYGGQRKTEQFLPVPTAPQQNPLHAGGVINLDRNYGGLDARWIGSFELGNRPFELVVGTSYDSLREHRSGYENYIGDPADPVLGVRGTLRRLERNRVSNFDLYAQATWELSDEWTVEAGVRRSRVRFDSRDHYIVGPNGDDSGSANYTQTLPAASLRWQPSPDLAFYLSAARGFETPTLNELSYRPDGLSGLNFALRPSVNDNIELGAKARIAGGLLTAALFETRTKDEIVTATSSGGRSTYHNATRTQRRGFEVGWQHETENHWRTQVALTWLDARYRDEFCSPEPCDSSNLVSDGNRIPGIARQALFASFGWIPPQGWRAGAELRALSSVPVNDVNTASAPGYAIASLHAGYVKEMANWKINAFARVDNLFDRRYVGSVIVNDGNDRYFEPAPGRNWVLGFGATYRF